MSTQNVAGAEPPADLTDSQSEFPNNQATVCEEIRNGSKVLRESWLGCRVRKFTKICFYHWLLCYWLIKCIPSNFDSELWNHLEFFHKLSFVWRGTSMSYPPYPLIVPTWCRFWVLTHWNSKCILSFGVECNIQENNQILLLYWWGGQGIHAYLKWFLISQAHILHKSSTDKTLLWS